jgi:hypothetical protein
MLNSIRIRCLIVTLVLGIQTASLLAAPCTFNIDETIRITLPESYELNVPFDIRVEVLKLPEPDQQMELRFNHLKRNGKFGGGLQSAAGKIRVGNEAPFVFEDTVTITKQKPDMGVTLLTVYLSPDRSWRNRTLQANVPILPPDGNRKLYEEQLGRVEQQSTSKPQRFETYTPRTEYFSQRVDDPGKRNWKRDPQTLPPLEDIIARPAPDCPVYGVYSWAKEYVLAADEVARIGFKTMRLSGPWDEAEAAMLRAARDNIEVLYTLTAAQTWDDIRKKKRPYYDSDDALLADFAANVKAFVKRFGPGGTAFEGTGLESPLATVELWNEPNFHYLIPDSGNRKVDEPAREALYAKMIGAGYEAVKSVAPDLPVTAFAAGGSGSGDVRFIQHIHENNPGIAQKYDILSTHPYIMGAPPETQRYRSWGSYSIANNNALIRKILADAGVADKPVWWTEIGWQFADEHGGRFPVAGNRTDLIVTPDRHAAYVVRCYLWALRLGIERVHIMHLYDTDSFNGGFVERKTLEWRPVAHAVKQLIDTMPNPVLTGAVSDGKDGLYVYTYTADHTNPGRGHVTVVWNVDGPRTVAVPTVGNTATLYDMVGNRKTVNVSGGQVTFEAGPYPVYVLP